MKILTVENTRVKRDSPGIERNLIGASAGTHPWNHSPNFITIAVENFIPHCEGIRMAAATIKSDIAKPDLADKGKKRILWADHDMPVLTAIRARFEKEKPLKGLRMSACL
ncbi:MAG TPA: adenosylhomocysteinase, partial [Urbifossiella sp.]